MSHVSSSDSLNSRRTSSDSGKDPDPNLGVTSDPSVPAPRGPGPVVPRRKGSDPGGAPRAGSWQERRSCSSLSGKEVEPPLANGCNDRSREQKLEKVLPFVLF